MKRDHPLTQKEFWDIYRKVPRLTVEAIFKKENAYFLTKRNIEPCRGLWHFPGGTVWFGEKLTDAVKRISLRELGVRPTNLVMAGYIEYPSHYLEGLDSPIGIAFLIKEYEGSFTANQEAADSGWFVDLPEIMHQEQKDFIAQLTTPF